MSHAVRRGSRGTQGGATFDPINDVGWRNAYWAEGTEFTALSVADGGVVATWPDEIGTQDLTQSSNDLRPLYRATGGANSKPCIESDGTNDYLAIAAASMTALAQPDTIVIVGAYNSLTPANAHLFDGPSLRQMITGRNGSLSKWHMYAGGNVVAGGNSDTNPHLLTAYFNGTSSVTEVDGTANVIGGGGASNPGTSDLDGIFLFCGAGPSVYAAADIAFVGLYSGDARSDGGWADFENWCETYYGLTIA